MIKAERDLKQLELVIADTKSRIVAMQTRISQTDKKLADSNAVLRNFQDNLRLRRERKNLASIDNELEGLDEAGARKAYREFETKYNDQRQRQTDKQAKVRSDLILSRECWVAQGWPNSPAMTASSHCG